MKEEGMGELLTSTKLFSTEGVCEHPLHSPLHRTQPTTREASAYMPYKSLSLVEKGLAGSSGPGADKCLRSVGKDPHPPLRLSSHPGNPWLHSRKRQACPSPEMS